MIKLEKSEKPSVLSDNAEAWRDEYVNARRNGNPTDTQKYRYRHQEIKKTIKTETHRKCAYCESKISHIHPGEIDHIFPISKRPDLYVEWENLTYACTECNRRKSDYYNEDEPLVNPYSDQPSAHLSFFGPLVLDRDAKGYLTRKLIDLSRIELVERKQERIEQVSLLVRRWLDTPEGPTRNFLKMEILEQAAGNAEFAATIQAYLKHELGWSDDDRVVIASG